jgi:hypothetical protein
MAGIPPRGSGASLGEPNIDAVGDTDRFGTLGGHGPADLGAASMRQAIVAAGGTYDLSGPARAIGVDGSGDIGGAKPVNPGSRAARRADRFCREVSVDC